MAPATTRHLTILITDIKGFTDKTSHRSRADIQRLLDDHRDVVLPVLEGRGGHLVKTMGDAFMMTYDSPTDAVLAGVAAQEALAKHNHDLPESERIEIRVAINAGEVNLAENDVFGEAVNITARIEGVAEAGEVYFTEAVYLAMNKTEVPSSEIGLLQLKGIPEKVRVYKVRRETPVGTAQMPLRPAPVPASGFAPGEKARFAAAEPAPKPAPPAGARPSSWRRAAALALDGLICTILVGSLFGKSDPGSVHIKKHLRSGKGDRSVSAGAGVSLGESGIRITGDDGAKVVIDQKGVQVSEGKGGSSKVTDEDGSEVVLHDKDGLRVTAREGDGKRSLFPLGWFAYNFLFLWFLAGTTPGKKVLKLRVVAQDGSAPGWKPAFLRALMSLVSGSLLMLGYAWGLWDARGRTWHDAVAGTRVVPAE